MKPKVDFQQIFINTNHQNIGAPRLSGQTSIFGGAFFVSKSLLGIEGQKKLKKLPFCPESLGAMFEY